MSGSEYLPEIEFGDSVSNGMWRRLFDNAVTWVPDYIYYDGSIDSWDYVVEKFADVPGFHVCEVNRDDGELDYVLSTHKTLHEAMAICKVLLANGGVGYE